MGSRRDPAREYESDSPTVVKVQQCSQPTHVLLRHDFIVFETRLGNEKRFYSIEKVNTQERSKLEEYVGTTRAEVFQKCGFDGTVRKSPSVRRELVLRAPGLNLDTLLKKIRSKFDREFRLLSDNCQHFANDVYTLIRETNELLPVNHIQFRPDPSAYEMNDIPQPPPAPEKTANQSTVGLETSFMSTRSEAADVVETPVPEDTTNAASVETTSQRRCSACLAMLSADAICCEECGEQVPASAPEDTANVASVATIEEGEEPVDSQTPVHFVLSPNGSDQGDAPHSLEDFEMYSSTRSVSHNENATPEASEQHLGPLDLENMESTGGTVCLDSVTLSAFAWQSPRGSQRSDLSNSADWAEDTGTQMSSRGDTDGDYEVIASPVMSPKGKK